LVNPNKRASALHRKRPPRRKILNPVLLEDGIITKNRCIQTRSINQRCTLRRTLPLILCIQCILNSLTTHLQSQPLTTHLHMRLERRFQHLNQHPTQPLIRRHCQHRNQPPFLHQTRRHSQRGTQRHSLQQAKVATNRTEPKQHGNQHRCRHQCQAECRPPIRPHCLQWCQVLNPPLFQPLILRSVLLSSLQ